MLSKRSCHVASYPPLHHLHVALQDEIECTHIAQAAYGNQSSVPNDRSHGRSERHAFSAATPPFLTKLTCGYSSRAHFEVGQLLEEMTDNGLA